MLFCEYLFCEGWISPNMAMIQTVIDVKYKSVAIGVYLFGTTIAGTLGSFVVGELITLYAPEGGYTVGVIMAVNTSVPCLVAAFCFYMAGGHYSEFKR